MYSDKAKKSLNWLWLCLAALALLALLWAYVTAAEGSARHENSIASIRETVESSARQCYVVEGVYPPDLDYLRDNYGLQINTDDYYVVYDIYASNQPPTVKVVAK